VSSDPRQPAPVFQERLSVPLRWWLVALSFVISVFVAVAFYLGPGNGLILTAACAAIVVAVLVPYGSRTITVDDEALTVGPHRIEWAWVGGAKALDAAAARHRLGPDADVRAHLVVRPYIPEGVEVTVVDIADPHPYWFVNSRRAAELADAINARAVASLPAETTDAES